MPLPKISLIETENQCYFFTFEIPLFLCINKLPNLLDQGKTSTNKISENTGNTFSAIMPRFFHPGAGIIAEITVPDYSGSADPPVSIFRNFGADF